MRRASALAAETLLSGRGAGARPSAQAIFDLFVREQTPPFALWPPSGPAPLEVTFTWLIEMDPRAAIEFSADGTARQPWENPSVSPHPRRHTYAGVGRYRPTVC